MQEELQELDDLVRKSCHYPVKGGPENKHGKVNALMQVRGFRVLRARLLANIRP